MAQEHHGETTESLPLGPSLPSMKKEVLEAVKYLMHAKHGTDHAYIKVCIDRALLHLGNFAQLSTMGSEALRGAP